jgi:hypothetical protein
VQVATTATTVHLCSVLSDAVPRHTAFCNEPNTKICVSVEWDDGDTNTTQTLVLFDTAREASMHWSKVNDPPPLVLRLGAKKVNALFRGPTVFDIVMPEDPMHEVSIYGAFGVALGRKWLTTENGATLESFDKCLRMAGSQKNIFSTGLIETDPLGSPPCVKMPKTAYLIGETNASTGSITETSLVLGVMTPLTENASTFTACVDACAIVALPWRIFGRGKEGKTVSALAGQSKSYDLTKGDPTIKIYHREMFAKLKVRPIDTEVVFDRIMGVPMRFLFYTFLRRWRPLQPIALKHAWTDQSNLIAFLEKLALTPCNSGNFPHYAEPMLHMAGTTLAFEMTKDNEAAARTETAKAVAARYKTYAQMCEKLLRFAGDGREGEGYDNMRIFHTLIEPVQFDQLRVNLDELKPKLLTIADWQSLNKKEGVLEGSARNESEEKENKNKRKDDKGSKEQGASPPRRMRKVHTRSPEAVEQQMEEEEAVAPQPPRGELTLNLKALLDAASGKGKSDGTCSMEEDVAKMTVMAAQTALSAEVMSTRNALVDEQKLRLEAQAVSADLRIKLATKTAELEGMREMAAAVNVLRTDLETQRAARAAAEAEVKEKNLRIDEFKQQAKMQTAAFLAMAKVDNAAMTAAFNML